MFFLFCALGKPAEAMETLGGGPVELDGEITGAAFTAWTAASIEGLDNKGGYIHLLECTLVNTNFDETSV